MFEVKQSVALRLPVVLKDSSGNPVTGIAFGAVTASVEKSDGTTTTLVLLVTDWFEITTGAFSGAGKYTILMPATAVDVAGPFTYAIKVTGAVTDIRTVRVVTRDEVESYNAVLAVQTTVNSTATQATVDAANSNIAIMDTRIQEAQLTLDSTATQAGVDALNSNVAIVDTRVQEIQITTDGAATQAGLDAVNSNVAVLDTRVQQQGDQIETLYQFETGRWKIFTAGPDVNRIVYYKEDGVTVVAKYDLKDIVGAPTFRAAFERVKV